MWNNKMLSQEMSQMTNRQIIFMFIHLTHTLALTIRLKILTLFENNQIYDHTPFWRLEND